MLRAKISFEQHVDYVEQHNFFIWLPRDSYWKMLIHSFTIHTTPHIKRSPNILRNAAWQSQKVEKPIFNPIWKEEREICDVKMFFFLSAGLHCSVSTAIAFLMKLWGNCVLNSFLLQQIQNTVFHTFKCVQCEIISNSSLYFSLDLYKVQSLPFHWFVMYHLSTVTAAFEKTYFLYKQHFSYFLPGYLLYSCNYVI